jgi:hypothetical protein
MLIFWEEKKCVDRYDVSEDQTIPITSPEDGSNMLPRNVGVYLQVHTALLHREPTSTSLSPWEPQTLTMTAFSDVMPCSLVEGDRRFRNAYCIHRRPDYEVHTSETSVYFNETTRHYILEACHLHEPEISHELQLLVSTNFNTTT